MERVCPICNSLAAVDCLCPVCGGKMADGGALENYYGPYSPYMDGDSLHNFLPEEQCVHLLYCPDCNYDRRQAWEMVVI